VNDPLLPDEVEDMESCLGQGLAAELMEVVEALAAKIANWLTRLGCASR
jgi:hypothetical protein